MSPVQDLCDSYLMISKHLNLARRYSLLSPATMCAGMLLACVAWLMHITPLLTPLWDDEASLGHGICIKLAPIVSASHDHHSTTQHHLSISSTVHAPTVTGAANRSNTPALDLADQLLNQDDGAKQHNSCDICTAMSAVITPTVLDPLALIPIVFATVITKRWIGADTYHLSRFLRPFLRAPPSFLTI